MVGQPNFGNARILETFGLPLPPCIVFLEIPCLNCISQNTAQTRADQTISTTISNKIVNNPKQFKNSKTIQNTSKQFKTIQNNPKQFKTIQNNSKQSKIIQNNPKQSKTFQQKSKQSKTFPNNPKQFKTIQNNQKQFKIIQNNFHL